MKLKYLFFSALILFLASGCSGSISGTVVDTDTGQPIRGCRCVGRWTRTSGKWFGLRATRLNKAIEKVTDKEGRFDVSSVYNPFVDQPVVVVCKVGYI